MALWRPIDERTRKALCACGVTWPSVYWKRISAPALALSLLEQHGVADAVLRKCAKGDISKHARWVEELATEAKAPNASFRVMVLLHRASEHARRRGETYIGTEHLFVTCLQSDATLLNGTSSQLAAQFLETLTTFWVDSSPLRSEGTVQHVRWPHWAPRQILRPEDFPDDLASDAHVIIECMKLLSMEHLLKEPAVRWALQRHPKNVDEFRRYLVEAFGSWPDFGGNVSGIR